ncbi:MAG: 4'-phosphopantetheinyl transferase family protein [Streptomycetales bacterium]
MVAVTRGVPVGVDVEGLRPDRDHLVLADHVLSPFERCALRRLPKVDQPAGFLRYWTRKEAVLKASGDGLAVPLTTLVVSAADEPPRLLTWTAQPPFDEPVQLSDLCPGYGYVACVALLTRTPHRVVERDAQPLITWSRSRFL